MRRDGRLAGLGLFLALVLALGGCLPGAARSPSTSQRPGGEASARPGSESVTVWSVFDGDTFSARTAAGRQVTIRMLGIDAPEIDREDPSESDCGAAKSTQALERLIGKRHVVLVTDPVSDPTDRFDRLLRYVASESIDDVARQLVATGMVAAWYPTSEPTPTRFRAYQSLEDDARAKRVGLWASCEAIGR
ncbi:MAG: thermonuclease family protein [Propionicimonas sp.]